VTKGAFLGLKSSL